MQGPVVLPPQIVRPDNKYRMTPVDLSKLLEDQMKAPSGPHHTGVIGVAMWQAILGAHNKYMATLPGLVDEEVASVTSQTAGTALETANANLAALNHLIADTHKQLTRANTEVKKYFKFDPVSASHNDIFHDYIARSAKAHPDEASRTFAAGLNAAYEALALAQVLILLQAKADTLKAEVDRLNSQNALHTANTFTFTTAPGAQLTAIGTNATLEFNIDAAVRQAVTLLQAGFETAASRALGVGIGALVYSPSLGNGDLYPTVSLAVPASTLLPDLPANLSEIAARQGSISLPYRIRGNKDGYTLLPANTDSGVSSLVPVRALELSPDKSRFSFTTADRPPVTLVFPVHNPGNGSTTTPVVTVPPTTLPGITLKPVEVVALPLPATGQQEIRDCIYCFPAETGLPPLYIVFSSAYPGDDIGEFSGRNFEADKAGGPIIKADWRTATVTEEGIALVKLHTGRFDPSEGNAIMINRLEKILRNEMEITDIDKRFYTHEIRELERYREIGIPDNFKPDDDGTTWNNAHTATLEDYQLSGRHELLYTEDALKAN